MLSVILPKEVFVIPDRQKEQRAELYSDLKLI